MSRRNRRSSGLKAIIALLLVLVIAGALVYDLVFFVPNRNRMEWNYEKIAGYETEQADLLSGKLLNVWKFSEDNKPSVDAFLVATVTEDAEWGIIGFYASADEAKKEYDEWKDEYNDSDDDNLVLVRRGRAVFWGTKKASYVLKFMPF